MGLLSHLLHRGRDHTCGHDGAVYRCGQCKHAFCEACVRDHARRVAAMLQLQGRLQAFDEHDRSWCPRCVRSVEDAHTLGRTVIAWQRLREKYLAEAPTG